MSLGTSNRDGGKTSESGHLRALAKIVSGDVITGLNAVQRAAGVNMSVDVQVGDAFVRRSDGSYSHPVFNDAVYNQTISTADGANARRDIVVIYVDYAQAPSTAVSNNTNGVVKIKVVNGTPAGSPIDPTDAAIQASVGAGNPWTKLARVRVGAGATSIGNSVIDDLRTMISATTNSVLTGSIQDGAVTAAKIGDAQVTGSKLSTSSVLLGYASTIANFTTSNTTPTLITGMSLTFTVPPGGRSVKLTLFTRNLSNNASGMYGQLGIYDGAAGVGTRIGGASNRTAGASYDMVGICVAIVTPAAGSKTYQASLNAAGGGTAMFGAVSTEPAYFIAELL